MGVDPVPTPPDARARKREARRVGRHGMTLIELCIVLTVVAILLLMIAPFFRNQVLAVRATEAAADVANVQSAAMLYNAESGGWPAEIGPGRVPPALAPYLPERFTFIRNGYTLDWDNRLSSFDSARDPSEGVIVGVSVLTPDEQFGGLILHALGANAEAFVVGGRYTSVLFDSSSGSADMLDAAGTPGRTRPPVGRGGGRIRVDRPRGHGTGGTDPPPTPAPPSR